MATTDKKDKDKEKLRAYKFRLDPNQAQTTALYQAVGAARYTYNMLTAYNSEVNRLRDDYWKKRHDEGISDADIKKELKALAKDDKRYKQLKYGAFGTQYLTPEKKRHEQAEHRIENGEDPSVVWNQETERSANPWLHTANQRVLVSGLQNASDAWTISGLPVRVNVLGVWWVRRVSRRKVFRGILLRFRQRKRWALTAPRICEGNLPTSRGDVRLQTIVMCGYLI